MLLAIDTGTTNTRVYIVDNHKNVISKAYKKIGVRDSAIAGSRSPLVKGLKECVKDALNKADLCISDIDYAVVSGMLTTEMGLIDIPHLIAPVSEEDLIKESKVIKDKNIFPFDIPVVFIRGIKNTKNINELSEIRRIDFMKGEETQVIGILNTINPQLPCNILVFSSHTKLIHVDKDGKIAGSITTLSGQFYEAIKKQTFIGKSIDSDVNIYSEEILEEAYNNVNNAGLLRSLMVPRFMEVLMDTKAEERKFYVESLIASEDIKIIDEARDFYKYDLDTEFIFVGHESRCNIYKYLLNKKGINNKITSISDKDEIDMLAISGGITIASQIMNKEK